MLFIVALIISIIFVAVFKELLKKYPNIFYITAAVISIAAFVCSSYVTMPGWVRDYVVGIFAKGSLGTAFFVLVMYAGAMKNTWKATKTLMKIRGELSIMGCVLVLCHNCTYGRTYFRMLFTNTKSLSAAQMTAAIISLVLITIMLILTVTSFPNVRKKMNAVKWKKLQRTAYIFYGLIYVHILLINVPYARRGMTDYIINVAVYSLVFVNYAMMRIHKAAAKKVKKTVCSDEKKNVYAVSLKVGLTVAGLIVIVGAMFMCFVGIDNNDNADKVYAQLADNNQNNNDNKVLTEQDKTEKSTEAVTQESTDKESGNESQEAETQEAKDEENTETADSKGQISDTVANNSQEADNSVNNSPAVDTSSGSDSGSDTSDSKEEEVKITQTEAPRKFKADGTYSATVKCQRYNYMVTVQVVISSDTITQVTAAPATSDASDLMYFNMAADVIPSKLISAQGSSGVDTVSGATYSSKAIISGFNSAVN